MQKQSQSQLFNCYICFKTSKDAKMCPHCSKIACKKCITHWITNTKPSCPHCRAFLTQPMLADCQRLVNQVISALNNSQKQINSQKQYCLQHNLQINYYCEQCNMSICSDCAMFQNEHKGHKIVHLKKISENQVFEIQSALYNLDKKVISYKSKKQKIIRMIETLKRTRNQNLAFLKQYQQKVLFLYQLQSDLFFQYKAKQSVLNNQLSEIDDEIDTFENIKIQIQTQLGSLNSSQLINKSSHILKSIQQINDREYKIPTDNSLSKLNFKQKLKPQFQRADLFIDNFSTIQDSVYYSDPIVLSGVQWRLKIYPDGNGHGKGTHLSVFIQLYKGFFFGQIYQYQIQLISLHDSLRKVIKKYQSPFDIGQCWGYNQFCNQQQLKQISKNDQVKKANQLHFRVYIRNQNHMGLIKDNQQYIKRLQKENKDLKQKLQKVDVNDMSKSDQKSSSEQKVNLVDRENNLVMINKLLQQRKSAINNYRCLLQKQIQSEQPQQKFEQMQLLSVDKWFINLQE